MEMSVEICRNDVAEVKIAVVWWENEYFYYCDRVTKMRNFYFPSSLDASYDPVP